MLKDLRFQSFVLTLVVGMGCVFLGGFAVAPATAGESADWSHYRGPTHDGISPETGWLSQWAKAGPKILWKEKIGIGFSSMSVVGGKVYTTGYDADTEQGQIFCLDAETGKEIWKHTYASELRDKNHEGGPCSTPTVAGNSVLTLSKLGIVHCLNAESGKVVWEKDVREEVGAKLPRWSFAGSVIALDGKAIVDVGPTVAFDLASGDITWKTQENYGSAYSTPIPFEWQGKQCLAVFPESGLVILDASNGKEIARHDWETKYGVNAATPIKTRNKFFISSGYDRGGAVVELKDNGEMEAHWENKNMRNHFNSSVVWEGHIYGFDNKELTCLDYGTGDIAWSEKGLGKGSLTLADGKLIILSEKGELLTAEANPEKFSEISRAQILGGRCWTAPVLSGHRIYARNADGDLVCVDVSAG